VRFLNEYDDIERKSVLLYSKAVEKDSRPWQDIFLQLRRRNLNRGFQVSMLCSQRYPAVEWGSSGDLRRS